MAKPIVDPQPSLEERIAREEWNAKMADYELYLLRKKHRTLVDDEEILESETAVNAARAGKFIEDQRLEWSRDMLARQKEVQELKEKVLALNAELKEAREENEHLKLKIK